MPNAENITTNSERTPKKRQEIAKKGGIASGKARRERKAMRELLDIALSAEAQNKKTGETMTRAEAVTVALIREAMDRLYRHREDPYPCCRQMPRTVYAGLWRSTAVEKILPDTRQYTKVDSHVEPVGSPRNDDLYIHSSSRRPALGLASVKVVEDYFSRVECRECLPLCQSGMGICQSENTKCPF